MRTKLFVLLLCTFILSSCSNRVLDFTLISSKNVDLTKTLKKGAARVEGVDMVHVILTIPTGSISYKEALDRAIEKTPGCVALVDGVINLKAWSVLFYGQASVIIEGTPLIDASLAMTGEKIPDYSIVKLDKRGKVKEYKEISAMEFYAMKSKISK